MSLNIATEGRVFSLDVKKLLQPAFAVCRVEDFSLILASPYFYKIFPGAEQGKPLSEIFPFVSEYVESLSDGMPNIGMHIFPMQDNTIVLLRWMIIQLQNLIPFYLIDVLRLPNEIFDKTSEDFDNSTMELLLDSIHDGIWVIDGEGITLRINKAMQRIADIKPEEVVGKHIADAMELKKFSVCVTLHARDAKRPVTMFDDYANGKHCLNTSTPIFDEKGNVVRVIAIIRDLTELEDMSLRLEAMRNTVSYMPYGHAVDLDMGVLGMSPASVRLREAIGVAARTDAPVLLLGETGTGKTMSAKGIHRTSARSERNFISLNCGAIPSQLLESELFGYDSGAFTGALKNGKPGVFEMADKGTLFLDEIAELPLSAQVTLLHVLDGEPFRRVGGTTNIQADVRIIAATNKSLEKMVEEGTFRQDLFYRLRVIAIELPSLRERREDIPELLNYFLDSMAGGKEKPHLSTALRDALCAYHWPGNIREIRSVTRFLLALGKKKLTLGDLPPYLLSELPKTPAVTSCLREAVEALERDMISRALRETNSTYKAAKLLKVSQSTIVRKAQRYHLHEMLIQHK